MALDFNNLKTLVLNADLTPVGVLPDLFTIPAKDAVNRVLSGSCSVLAEYDRFIKTPNLKMKWPSVIMRKNFQQITLNVPLTKQNLWLAFDCSCGFCGVELKPEEVTIDHLIPKSIGGKDSWTNLVCSCWDCNQRKGSSVKLFAPVRKPQKPGFWNLVRARKTLPVEVQHESWIDFLPDWQGEIKVKSCSI